MCASHVEIDRWLIETFKHKSYKRLSTEIEGGSGRSDGFIGNIVFVKVTFLHTASNQNESLELALKYGKNDARVREIIPVRLVFEREIFVYTRVMEIGRELEAASNNCNLRILNNLLPKCYGTLLQDGREVIILENLKNKGYEMNDKYKPMSLAHLTLTMQQYGKWHAISLAHREKNPTNFEEDFEPLAPLLTMFADVMENNLALSEEFIFEELNKNGEARLERLLRERIPGTFKEAYKTLVSGREKVTVFRHGDCWNNNYMFKYHDNDKSIPVSVKFLDFQLAELGSPVTDLSYHLYCNASAEELSHFKELLLIYHSSLSATLRSLGCDPDKLFPYEELTRQWRKYSAYGIIMSGILLPFSITAKDEDFDVKLGENAMRNMLMSSMKHCGHLITPRIIAVVEHFLNFTDF